VDRREPAWRTVSFDGIHRFLKGLVMRDIARHEQSKRILTAASLVGGKAYEIAVGIPLRNGLGSALLS
jgi:hypothetical protein